ncbi:hypothetical protein CLU88_0510 [Acidovorax sp. 56]|nr:hypothetical protein CLU88_0510 [Acidovorax sp. 56]
MRSVLISSDRRSSMRKTQWAVSGVLLAALGACGGGSEDQASQALAQAEVATATTTLALQADELSSDAGALIAQPTFHVAPVVLTPPDDSDVLNANASATQTPKSQAVPSGLAALSTKRLTLDTLEAVRTKGMQAAPSSADGEQATPLAGSAVTTYTVAQVRAAYGFPALPAVGTQPTAVQAAQLGAGQTIYIVAAKHNPNAAAELAAFNQKFGLPTCTTRTLAASTALPLPAASTSGCELVVAYSSATGTLSATAPAYDSGWATEIALDVQWSHAIAPFARIVLVEAPDASVNNLTSAIRLANAMGPGVVSMSFGAAEGAWTSTLDSAFSTANMTYLAATGDWGAGVMWPSASANVLGVGGTTLTYSGTGSRSEVSWSGTGGGISAYVATPTYQKSGLPGVGSAVRRTVADVAMNADPATGHYLAVLSPGSSTVQWLSAGGTSLSSPMWAGLVAVANAARVQAAKPVLGAAHTTLYGQVGAVPGNYASGFADITLGSHGTCGTCSARVGYDQLTGLGTPNATNLVNLLSGASAPAVPPSVTSATINGQANTALSFTVSVTAPNPVTYALTGAPSGMAIGSTGVVTWAAPVAGSYAVTVTARDTKTGLSGQGVYTVVVAAPPSAPVVAGGTVAGKVGVALSFNATVPSSNPMAYTLAGAPSGMAINATTGVVTWGSPVLGNYSVVVTAKDTKTGLSGKGTYTVQITSGGLTITAPAMVGVVGKPLTGSIAISAPAGTSFSVSISGVPWGMGFSLSGTTITALWAAPVAGSYQLTVVAKDSAGRTTQALAPITVSAK